MYALEGERASARGFRGPNLAQETCQNTCSARSHRGADQREVNEWTIAAQQLVMLTMWDVSYPSLPPHAIAYEPTQARVATPAPHDVADPTHQRRLRATRARVATPAPHDVAAPCTDDVYAPRERASQRQRRTTLPTPRTDDVYAPRERASQRQRLTTLPLHAPTTSTHHARARRNGSESTTASVVADRGASSPSRKAARHNRGRTTASVVAELWRSSRSSSSSLSR